ncbi:hypothetical protein SPB21_03065 [Leptothoe sp. ISB3NOV94-8A]
MKTSCVDGRESFFIIKRFLLEGGPSSGVVWVILGKTWLLERRLWLCGEMCDRDPYDQD